MLTTAAGALRARPNVRVYQQFLAPAIGLPELVMSTLRRPTEVIAMLLSVVFFFSSRRRHTRLVSDWSSDVCSSDLAPLHAHVQAIMLSSRCGARFSFRSGGLGRWRLRRCRGCGSGPAGAGRDLGVARLRRSRNRRRWPSWD